ncbi:MAG: glycosyltransferase family 39 protein [Acetobacteraceae bacterium]
MSYSTSSRSRFDAASVIERPGSTTAGRLVFGGGLAFSAIALFGFLWMNFSAPARVDLAYAVIVLGLLFAARAIALRSGPLAYERQVGPAIGFARYGPVAIVLLGVVLRIAFSLRYPAALSSDDATYRQLAEAIIAGRSYNAVEGFAYWPPGVPFLFAPFSFALGEYAVLGFNLATFVAAEWVAFVLCRRSASSRAAYTALLLIAVWPNFVASAGLLEKENLLIVLWPAAALCFLQVGDRDRPMRLLHATLAGVLTGIAILVQPASIFLPLVFAAYAICAYGFRARTIYGIAVLWMCAGASILPWTVRNYVVLHQFVPITTAGGSNFFMVSGPRSDGRWNESGQKAALVLSADEVTRSRLGVQLGLRNIERYPVHYLSAVVRKPLYMYGQNSKNSYWVFARGGISGPLAYSILWPVSNAYYFAILILMAVYFFRYRVTGRGRVEDVLPVAMLFYPFLSNAMFEASERHRYGVLVFMAIFAATALSERERPRPRRAGA